MKVAPISGALDQHFVLRRPGCGAMEQVLIWDNRFTLHYPINDFSGYRRRMIRTTSLEAE
jgi:hypothetical protein